MWADHHRGCPYLARPPWHMPAPHESATVGAVAQRDDVWLGAGGDGQSPAVAQRAAATAAVGWLRHQQTTRWAGGADPGLWGECACGRATVARPRLEPPRRRRATERGGARLRAARVPQAVVQARRRSAQQTAPHQGDPPSQGPGTRGAWTLWSTPGAATSGQPPRGSRALPGAGQERGWCRPGSALALAPRASRPDLLVARGAAAPPALPVGPRPPTPGLGWGADPAGAARVAARGRQAILPSAGEGRRVLQQAWATAARLVVQASRTSRTTAHLRRERWHTSGARVAFLAAVNASLHAYAAGRPRGLRGPGADGHVVASLAAAAHDVDGAAQGARCWPEKPGIDGV